jgi:hypothetical protein
MQQAFTSAKLRGINKPNGLSRERRQVRLQCRLNRAHQPCISPLSCPFCKRNPRDTLIAMQDQRERLLRFAIDQQYHHLAVAFGCAMMRAGTLAQRMTRRSQVEGLHGAQSGLRQLRLHPAAGFVAVAGKGKEERKNHRASRMTSLDFIGINVFSTKFTKKREFCLFFVIIRVLRG